jgi:DNA ligase-1
MRYAELVAVSAQVAATTKRSEKIARIAELLRRTPPDEVLTAVGLLLGTPRQGRIGVGWATLAASTVEPAPAPTVDLAEVDARLATLAATSGARSQEARGSALRELLARMTADEQHHLVRSLTGEVRQGAHEGVVAEAAARAACVPVDALRRAAMLLGDLGEATRRALGGDDLGAVGLRPLVPVLPMLAATSATVAEAMAATGEASVEWKLDGARVQVHRAGDEVRIFTRNLNEVTTRLDAIVGVVRALPVREVVLDGEALGLDDSGSVRRFQDTMSEFGAQARGAGLQGFFFDVLHVDGASLIDRPLRERRAVLHDVVPVAARVPAIVTADVAVAQRFLDDSLASGHEGVMVKGVGSAYQAGRRGATWRKVKPVHTLDLVVLAAEWGHGRRRGWLSNLHLGARGSGPAPSEPFVMVGKTFKGMTDDLLRWQTEALQQLAVAADEHVVHVRPVLVVEVAVDGVQVSRRYPGGVALRFARVRRYRPDKGPADADDVEAVRSLLR